MTDGRDRSGGGGSDLRPGQFEWVCQDCGRGHPKNSPPCSRCGGMDLEREPISYDLSDAEAASYLELGKYHIVAAAVLLALVVLTALGVIPVPQLGAPSIDDAPGESERAAGIDLTVAEAQVRAEIDAYRAANDRPALEADADLAAVATYHNRHRAVAAHDEDVQRPTAEEDWNEFDYGCPRRPILLSVPVGALGEPGSIDAYENETDLAESVADGVVRRGGEELLLEADREAIGVDLHVYPDGSVYVALAAC